MSYLTIRPQKPVSLVPAAQNPWQHAKKQTRAAATAMATERAKALWLAATDLGPSRRHASPPERAPTLVHPLGRSFVRLGHTLSQYATQAQVFFNGLLGLSTSNLEPTEHNHAMAAMSRRLFEFRQLSGDTGAQGHYPDRQDIDNAAAALARQHAARASGAHLRRGIYGAAAWCRHWVA